MPNRRSLRVLWVALIPVLVFPLYGQSSCDPCPAPSNPCKRAAGRSTETNQCVYANQVDGTACDGQGVSGICWGGECVATECAGVPSYGICDEGLGEGSVGACVEDVCVTAAPVDQCVKFGVGRINCCSQAGCEVASGAYCNDPLTGVSCDPSGIEPWGQPGQDGICEAGACVAQTGLCTGVPCRTTADDPCARDYCDAETGQCDEWIVDTFTECLTASAPGICQGGTCSEVGGEDCEDGTPCSTSNPCKVAACRLPCTYKPTGCSPNDLMEELTTCYIDDISDGGRCNGQQGSCLFGNCLPNFTDCRDAITEQNPEPCDDGNPCTINDCDFIDLPGFCKTMVQPDDTPCAETTSGVFLGQCQNSVCLPDLCIDRDCSDGDSCTDDVCNSPYGVCSNPTKANGEPCDGEPGQCLFGNCQPILPTCGQDSDCDDGNSCTEDTCPAGVCDFDPLPNGAPCIGENGQCLLGSCLGFGF